MVKYGKIVSIDSCCSSLKENYKDEDINSIMDWGPTALLPIFQILGCNYQSKIIVSKMLNNFNDAFTKIDFVYKDAVASIKVAERAKTEGELIITGSKGYVVVPSPWWKTDYFEVRYENPVENKRYFYQLDGEGIRYELVSFVRSIQECKNLSNINREISLEICKIMEDFQNKNDFINI